MALVSLRVGSTAGGGSTGGSMASTTTNIGGGSRLAAMQARLQAQLMVEKESRLLEMAARQEAQREGTIQRVTRSSASSLSSSLSSIGSTGGQGRVRKLFEERRSNGYNHSPVGWDKSYPLEPVRGGGSGGSGGRPPPGGGRQMKGLVRNNRGGSVDRAPQYQDTTAMKRSRSHATLQRAVDPRSPPRNLRPPIGRTLSHHKSTSSLLDANQNYNSSGGRGSSGSSSGIYSREHSRDTSPASSPPPPANRFGYRANSRDRSGSRGPSPSPPLTRSPRKSITSLGPQRNNTFTRNHHINSPESMSMTNNKSSSYQYQQNKRNSLNYSNDNLDQDSRSSQNRMQHRNSLNYSNDNLDQDNRSSQNRMPQRNQFNKENRYNQDNRYNDDSQDYISNGYNRKGYVSRSNSSEQEYEAQEQRRSDFHRNSYDHDTGGEQFTSMRNKTNNNINNKPKQISRTPSMPIEQPSKPTTRPLERQQKKGGLFNGSPAVTNKAEDVIDSPPKPPLRSKPKPPLKPKPQPRVANTPTPMNRKATPQEQAPQTPKPIPKGMAQCKICGRNFNSDRLEKHETICAKSAAKAKKRKVFDPAKMRTKGTEAEKYVARGEHLKETPKPKKVDWRKKHQDFIATVRAAKGIKGYEAAPLDTSDYIQCPHCGRKFSEGAADRHIPKCSSIKSNKRR